MAAENENVVVREACTVGQVTAVVTFISVALAIAPIADCTNGLWPSSRSTDGHDPQIHSPSNPASCALTA